MAILPPSLQGIHISKPMNEGLPREADTCHNSPPLAFSLNQSPLPHPPTCVCLPRGIWGYWNSVSISQLSYACYLHVRHIASSLNQSCSFCALRKKNRSPSFSQDPVLKTSTIYMTSSYATHHQELKSIIQWLLSVVFRAVVFKFLVWCGAEGYVSDLQDAAASFKPDT